MAILIREIKEMDYLDYKKIRLEMVTLHPNYFDVDLVSLKSRKDEDWKQDVIDNVRDSNKRRYLAYEKNICIGMIGFEIIDDVMSIGSFYVENEHRNRGIGRKLMEKCLKLSKIRDCRSTKLWVSTTNGSATAWYKRLGFMPTTPPTIKKFDHLDSYEECLITKLQSY